MGLLVLARLRRSEERGGSGLRDGHLRVGRRAGLQGWVAAGGWRCGSGASKGHGGADTPGAR